MIETVATEFDTIQTAAEFDTTGTAAEFDTIKTTAPRHRLLPQGIMRIFSV